MPDDLREMLLAKGHSTIDIGDICLDLGTGTITRSVALDGQEVARVKFPSREIDWGIVSKA